MKQICAGCQKEIQSNEDVILITVEPWSHNERTWTVCSEECKKIVEGEN